MQEELSHVDYGLRFLLRLKYILLFILLLIIGILFIFPVKDTINYQIQKALSSNRNCPISYEKWEYTFFPLGIKILNTHIPSRCSGHQLIPLTIPASHVYLSGLSFSPFGVLLSSKLEIPFNPLEFKMILGISQHALRIDNASIQLKNIFKITQNIPYQLRGNLQLNTKILFSQEKIEEGAVRIEGENLFLPSQSIKGFELPPMELGPLDIVLNIPEGGKIYQIKRLSLGTPSSSLRLKGEGTLTPVQQSLSRGSLNLKLELSPSEKLIQDFMILETLLQSYNQKDGFYRIKIQGNMASPKVQSF